MPKTIAALLMTALLVPALRVAAGPDQWRAEKRLIDMHMHVNPTPEHLDRAVKIMDAAGIGVAVNLGVGTVTPAKDGGPSALARAKKLADERHPGRFVQYMILDYAGFDDADFGERAAKQVEEGHRLGAAGLKEFKRLGLYLRDGRGKLIKVDDPKLDPVWAKCGELGMPVSIHVADPKAFWEPYDDKNERWRELKPHRNWWFGDTKMFPPRMEIVEALSRVIARHPKTTFVCVHFANNAEDIAWVDAALTKYPNMMLDLAARIPEVGRHDPAEVRAFFVKHQDRIVFGTDFQVYQTLTLGSGGDGPPPTDDDAKVFFDKHWRFLETGDRDWAHMTPIQGDWTINSIGAPPEVLRKVYFDNARGLLARSLPAPVMKAARAGKDFEPDGDAEKAAWKKAAPVRVEYSLKEGGARPGLSTEVKCLWSDDSLYFLFTSPYTRLTTFDPPSPTERLGLWDRDVVEVFVAPDPQNVRRYGEYEVAPTNERLDVLISPTDKDFAWDSRFRSAVKVDEGAKVWTAELRIPLASLGEVRPKAGQRWRLNLYRSDRAGNVFLAWNPTLTPTAHTPERFGVIEFAE
jgi:predicted TIM-barrel fold metal-dependent hydrolase